MKILVTGATGLLGSHLIATRRQHFDIRATARKINPRSLLGYCMPENVEFIAADLLNDDLSKLLDGIETVVHVAALASTKQDDADLIRATSVDGTQRLYQMAKRHHVKRWVQISSVATLSGPSSDEILTEKNSEGPRTTTYGLAKSDTDKWLLSQNDSIRKIFIHPCYMFGEWDSRPSSGAVLFALRFGLWRHYISGVKNFVSAQDVAKGIWAALEGNVEGHFLLGGENVTILDFLQAAAKELNLKDFSPTEIKLSEVETICKPTERPLVLEFCSARPVSSRKAHESFGYTPKDSLVTMLKHAVDYFDKENMLRRAK
jgi:nucleoside-diphosphate-sugar epimerase